MTPTFKIITNDEWLAMKSAWLQQRDAWLAKYEGQISAHDAYFHATDFYTTRCDGFHHPCDAPGIAPMEFFLAVMRDPAIPVCHRINAMGKVMELFPEWRPTEADYLMSQGLLTFIQSGMMEMLSMEETTVQ